MQFLRAEVESEQKIKLAKSGFKVMSNTTYRNNDKKKEQSFRQSTSISEELATAAGLLTTSKDPKEGCVFCANSHKAMNCRKAQKMSLQEKRDILQQKRRCYLCFKPGHNAKFCRNRTKCLECGRGHHTIMCENLSKAQTSKKETCQRESEGQSSKSASDETKGHSNDEALANFSSTSNVFLQTLIVKVRGNGVKREARAIFDSASQRSYILKETAAELGYHPSRTENVQHTLFGGSSTGVCSHGVYTELGKLPTKVASYKLLNTF